MLDYFFAYIIGEGFSKRSLDSCCLLLCPLRASEHGRQEALFAVAE
jgi:hypothetical protein